MEKRSKNLFMGLSLNNLKIIGFITMFVDHIALYFYNKLTPEIYLIGRLIGRIAMPLFVYILVQGYMHTSNLKKYILRLSVLAIITQSIIYILSYINHCYFPNYIINMNEFLNILFSFVLSLILIKALDFTKEYLKGFKRYVNVILRIITIICISIIYYYIDIDYSLVIPIMSVNFFIFEKLKLKIKNENLNLFFTSVEMLLMLSISICYNRLEIFTVIDILILILYNGKKKNRFDLNRLATYSFFPLHNFILYFIAMLIGG